MKSSILKNFKYLLVAVLVVAVIGTLNVYAVLGDNEGTNGAEPTSSAGEKTPSDGETTPSDGETTPSDGETTPSDGETTPSDSEITPSDGETTPSDGETTPSDGEATTSDGEEEKPRTYGGGSSSISYKITTKIENGKITPANKYVRKNADQEFTFAANEGYEIVDVLIDGKSIGVVDSYKFEKVTSKHTIEVKTAKITPFEKIDNWAKEEVAKAIDAGLIPETFNKKDATKAISRADFAAVAVKLYEKVSGKKATPVEKNPFTDTSDEYVLKAYALGITIGTSETTFTPNKDITREQMATMLTRALAKLGADVKVDLEKVEKFADDDEMHDWGRPSIYFMAEKEIIKGVGDNRFNVRASAKVEEALVTVLRCAEYKF